MIDRIPTLAWACAPDGSAEFLSAEEVARIAKVRFEGILEIAQDGIISIDSQHRVILFNKGAEKIFGYAQAEVLGRPLDMLLPQRFAEAHRRHIGDFSQSPDVARTMGQRREVSGLRRDGSEFPAEASISKLDLDGEFVFTVILRDITERKRAEQRLVTQHTVTQVLAEASTLKEATPRILQAVCDCLGWDLGELWRVDRVANELRRVEVWHKESIEVPQFLAAGSSVTFNSGIGLPGRVWSSHQPIYVADVVQDSNFKRASIAAREGIHGAFAFPVLLGQEVVGVMAFFSREIRQPDQELLDMMATVGSQIGQFVERKNAEEALRQSMRELKGQQELLDLAQRAARAMAFDWYIQQDVNKWTPEQEALYGLAPGSFDGTYQNWKKLIHPDDWPTVLKAVRHAQQTGEVAAEFRVRWPDGSTHWLATNGQMFFDDEHKPFRMVGFTTDVTQRKMVEEELRRSEAYLAEGQRLSHTGSFGWNVPTGEIYWSAETFSIFGYDLGIKPTLEFVLERVHPEDRAVIQQIVDTAMRDRCDFEFENRLLMPDGSVKYLHVVARALETKPSRQLEFVGTVMDITERKLAEARLRQDEMELRRMTDAIPQLICVLAPDGKTLFVNRKLLQYCGLDEDALHGPELRENLFHPDDLARVKDARDEALKLGVPFELELRARRYDGVYRWFLERYNPLHDERGNVIRWYATDTDIEDRKQAEERVQNENLALREEIDRTSMFEEIVGSSAPLRAVLRQVAKVAAADSTVLILGETGTGKELIARAIHKSSKRAGHAFIRVNCAAIPPSLIASELFGHEKGAFTGAIQRRIGRFEAATGGTLFLDEIGELPMETQVALLRVLQEREFERIGGGQPIRVDVRVLAATNRDLKASVGSGAFRQDLFYRLNVFPIEVPPLRERKDDIPVLIEYLIDRYAKKAGKKFSAIDKRTLQLFQSYEWPGNVRELQNVVERAVIVCEDGLFVVDETWLKHDVAQKAAAALPLAADLADHERERIEAALAESRGRISGPTGAAARLGIPRQTLESKIRNLGINKHKYKAVGAD